jgi:Dolichyl-phosphate-mannose-protein mannosyltransferase
MRAVSKHRRLAWVALALILAVALGLRLWGVKQGLPYAYNSDENAHFVPRAIGMFVLGLNPEYFANPPAYTYLLHVIFAVWFGGRAGVSHEFALHPGTVFVVARVTAALLGTLAVWLLYLTGARLLGRAVALLAAALMAVAFLPVFYAHLALNDVPTLAPLTLSLLGSAGVLRKGRRRDYAIAGIGLGLGCATKYTAGIVVLPLLAAGACQFLTPTPGVGRAVVVGLLLAGALALIGFVLANPYAVLDFQSFHAGITHQSQVSQEGEGKLGASREGGIAYYLWSFTWGLGWVPSLAALGGALTIWWRERRLGLLLVPAPLLFLAFMGLQGRYFGRWLLPIFPIVCLLAALFAVQLVGLIVRNAPRLPGLGSGPRTARALSIALGALVLAALCGQGALYSVHSGMVLSRADTRNLTRAWMVAHVPAGTHIVVEPVVPDPWAQDIGHPTLSTRNGYRWIKYPALVSVIAANGALAPEQEQTVNLEDYERTLSPALIPYYESRGFCWVVSGSTQSGRAFADPRAVPHAVAYYRALAAQAEVVYHASPYSPGSPAVPFDFDWTFDYYPLAYHRPGPEMTVYRLRGGRCSKPPST